jgi:hypothetical protein
MVTQRTVTTVPNNTNHQLREKDEEFNLYPLTMVKGTDSIYIVKLFHLLALMKNLQLPRNYLVCVGTFSLKINFQ